MKKFPKTLYVKIEYERESEDDFLIASDDISDLSEPETTISAAEYKLIAVRKVINETKLLVGEKK